MAAEPAQLHPYSPVRSRDGRLAHVSGVLPYAADGSSLVTDPEAAVQRCLALLEERLDAAGFALDDVVKTTVFLTDLGWLDTVNRAYTRTFREPRPARSAVEVCGLPRGAPIEIEAVVHVPERSG